MEIIKSATHDNNIKYVHRKIGDDLESIAGWIQYVIGKLQNTIDLRRNGFAWIGWTIIYSST